MCSFYHFKNNKKGALFPIRHAHARAHTHTHTDTLHQHGIPAIPTHPQRSPPLSRAAASVAPSVPQSHIPPSRSGPGAHPRGGVTYPAPSARQSWDVGRKGSQASRKKRKEIKRVGSLLYFPLQGEVLRPMHSVALQLWFRRKFSAAENAAAGVESCGAFPSDAGASIFCCPRLSLDSFQGLQDPLEPCRFPPGAGLSCHMHLRNPSSCAKKSPWS